MIIDTAYVEAGALAIRRLQTVDWIADSRFPIDENSEIEDWLGQLAASSQVRESRSGGTPAQLPQASRTPIVNPRIFINQESPIANQSAISNQRIVNSQLAVKLLSGPGRSS